MNSEFKRLSLYKTRSSTQPFSTMQRMEVTEKRRDTRLTLMLQKRNITAYMSPINSPCQSEKKVSVKQSKQDNQKTLLMKWQEKKQKRLQEEKAKRKQVFKVYHINHSVKPDLNDIYSKIKGKPVSHKSKSLSNDTNETFKIAPSSSYKFKPPRNIKPIDMKTSNNNKKPLTRRKLEYVISNCSTKTSGTSTVNSTTPIKKTRSFSNKETVSTTALQKPLSLSEESSDSDDKEFKKNKCDVTPTVESKFEKENYKTPTKHDLPSSDAKPAEEETKPITYISPFITLSRGKDNARREYIRRCSNVLDLTCENPNSTPKAAAVFFSNLLQKQESRLNDLCISWKTYEEEEKPPEEACDMIRTAIGQTELLLRKKFSKFTELINACKTHDSQNVVTCIDLHGFWDMVMIQVNNLDKRFENLQNLKSNNWIEILPEPSIKKQPKTKKDLKKRGGKEGTSALRNLIKEARKKKLACEPHLGGSPKIELRAVHNRLSNISNTTPKTTAIINTPIKRTRKDTPKSILKSAQKLSRSAKKSVLFADDKENMSHSFQVIEFSPLQPRRSSRLAGKMSK